MKIILVANTSWYIYNFRSNLIHLLKSHGHEISVIAPHDGYVDKLIEMGVEHCELSLSQRGLNAFKEAYSCIKLFCLLRAMKPDVVLTFTVKCNLYTALCGRLLKFDQIANVSGLGEAFDRKGSVNRIVSGLYRLALAKSKRVFFQNYDDLQEVTARGLLSADVCERIPGSGVDLEAYCPSTSFRTNRPRRFLMFGRLVPQKGYGLFLDVARAFHNAREGCVEFCVMGMVDSSRKESTLLFERILSLCEQGIVQYLEPRDNVIPVLHDVDAVILPSEYNEGVPRCLIEAMACGKPIITTDWKGCRDTVEHGVNGYAIQPGNREELRNYIRKLATISEKQLQEMGAASRRKAELQFAEEGVLRSYLSTINSCIYPEDLHKQMTTVPLGQEEKIKRPIITETAHSRTRNAVDSSPVNVERD